MRKRMLLMDLLGVLLVFTGSVASGLVINDFQSVPLPLVYVSPKDRLNGTVAAMGSNPETSVGQKLDSDVTLDEMSSMSLAASVTILDARPEIFYRVGHIPSALSLPRDEFQDHYHALESKLSPLKEKVVVVYCSGNDCQDSQLVADALLALGYKHVRVFRGGWDQWESAHYPKEKE